MLSISTFFGHLHPVLVHLPIGVLILSFIFQWYARIDKSANFKKTIDITLLVGMISAILSCITGYILSGSGDYDEQMVSWHQWMGIGVAFTATLMFYLQKKNYSVRWQWPLSILLVLQITITGHLGGSLTHGSDYLTQPLTTLFDSDSLIEAPRKPIPDVQQALAYADIIQPLLQRKCYSCHNANKKKGGLEMDKPDLLMKGGKDGVVIVAGKADQSELMKRLTLDRNEEHHMPPKEKPQLNEQEIALLRWWIDEGADLTKKVKDLQQPEKMKPILVALQNTEQDIKQAPDLPASPVEAADESAIKNMKDKGIVILPVAQNSNYLLADFVTAGHPSDSLIRLLLPVKKQLVWLKLSNSSLTDSALNIIGQCNNLTRLQVDHTKITDKGLPELNKLTNLRYLNLVGDSVSTNGILQLKGLDSLRALFLYQTNVAKKDWQQLHSTFPKAQIDSGGYVVPLLQSDTTIVKPPPVKKEK